MAAGCPSIKISATEPLSDSKKFMSLWCILSTYFCLIVEVCFKVCWIPVVFFWCVRVQKFCWKCVVSLFHYLRFFLCCCWWFTSTCDVFLGTPFYFCWKCLHIIIDEIQHYNVTALRYHDIIWFCCCYLIKMLVSVNLDHRDR